ncbi:hypothetical protein ER45_030415 (plasmid) [Bacillus mycoides]|nr:hypothetical protein ER45_030415 [Bacillus mycoides]
MEQLNLFELETTTVISTQNEEMTFKLSPNIEQFTESKKIVEEAIIESITIDRSMAPTWKIDYYDKAKRSRIDWVRAEDEDLARKELRKKVRDDILFIDQVALSSRTLEEIEALD